MIDELTLRRIVREELAIALHPSVKAAPPPPPPVANDRHAMPPLPPVA